MLVSASDRLKNTNFAGILTDLASNPDMEEENQPTAELKKKRQRIRPGKGHLKFPLYLDEQIGFGLKNCVVDGKVHDVSTTINLHDAVSVSLLLENVS